jgi:hypothetical protein
MISDNVEFFTPHFYAVFWQPFWKWQTSWKFWKWRIAPLMVTYHYVKRYVSIIIQLEVININVQNFNFPIGFYSNPHPLWTPKIWLWPPLPQIWKLYDQLETYIYNSTKFHEILSVVPEICHEQVHGPQKERRIIRRRIVIIITRYDYNLTIIKSPKPATDNRFKKLIKSYLEFLWYCVSQFENGDR